MPIGEEEDHDRDEYNCVRVRSYFSRRRERNEFCSFYNSKKMNDPLCARGDHLDLLDRFGELKTTCGFTVNLSISSFKYFKFFLMNIQNIFVCVYVNKKRSNIFSSSTCEDLQLKFKYDF